MKSPIVGLLGGILLLCLGASVASAFVPPPCTEDPTRTIFAGLDDRPCAKFNGDETSCELAYYTSGEGVATSCTYVNGACRGCGGNNLACATNTCNGFTYPVSTISCLGEPSRTALLGEGNNGSRACRNLDNTDQATCENAYYHDDDGNDDPGVAVACHWVPTNGTCVGCGDDGNFCPYNRCDPAAEAPGAECVEDPGRSNLLGYGGNSTGRCRQLDDTDAATCENAYYEDEDSGVAVACWWDGDDCRGSGFGGEDEYYAAWNECLSTLAPPVADATCPLGTERILLGFGNNGTGACRQFDDTDQATCENAYYEDLQDGTGVACWWDGDDCRGSAEDHRLQNACYLEVPSPSAVCAASRTNLLGFGHNDSAACRQLDNTDEATCENAFYEEDGTGYPIACFWEGDGTCGACRGNNDECTANPCVEAQCAGDLTRTTFVGFGNLGGNFGQDGGACRQLDGTSEAECEDAFYLNKDTQKGVACWWDAGLCRGTSNTFSSEDECFVPPTCENDPDRMTYLGFGNNGTAPCGSLDDTDQATCEDAFYANDDSEIPVACWWAGGGTCLGSSSRNASLNACKRAPVMPSATCPADPTRTTLVGFGHNGSGDQGAACRQLDSTSEAVCESAFYEDLGSHAAIACWWDAGSCRGSVNTHQENNTCEGRELPCTFDPSRTTSLGVNYGSDLCAQLNPDNGGDQASCEAAFYTLLESGPMPVACLWRGNACEGALGVFDDNECYYEHPPLTADATCGVRTTLLGLGSGGQRACRALDETDQATCEDAFYESGETGNAVACWWDAGDDACRGSGDDHLENNVCPVEGACFADPDRTNLLGFGGDGSSIGQNGGACRQLDDSDQATCENSFYIDGDGGDPVACWWDGDDCRGSNGNHTERNLCQHEGFPDLDCPGRTMNLGPRGNNICRQLDGTNQATCESAFYISDNVDFAAVGCLWATGVDWCLGTSRWPDLNACGNLDPPACAGDLTRTVFLGKGDKNPLGTNGGACRQFDNTDEATCENAFYANRENQPIACWWDAGPSSCRGTSRDDRRQQNECLHVDTCGARATVVGFGTNGEQPCRALGDETTCNDAYYLTNNGSRPVACFWDAGDSECDGCGRNAGENQSDCPSNACEPLTCADGARTRVSDCSEMGAQASCEDSWQVNTDYDFAAHAAACVWDAQEDECFACDADSQSNRECTNVCVSGCGNGMIDMGETCDDGNMYDGDCCDGMCQLENDGSPCTDRLFCTVGAGTCDSGECVGAEPRPCSSCVANDCDELDNECGDGGGGEPAVAALQGMGSDMSFPEPPGTECDDGIPGTDTTCDGDGNCEGLVVTATATATATTTATPTTTTTSTPTITPTPTITQTPTITATATITPTPTETPVPVGGPCDTTGECVSGATCVEGICTAVISPAPATSNRTLLLIVAVLLGVAAVRFGLRRARTD